MGYDQQLLKGSVSIMLLKLLRENDMYGYQIIKELERRSNDVFLLNEGALYPLLHKLESEGHITSYWEDSENGRRRKYYHITQNGALHYERKLEDWQNFSHSVNLVLGGVSNAKMYV